MFGLLNVNKPSGVTSRDVVNHVQRLGRPVKVGHAGTLDPLANGVLVVSLGQATRLTPYLHDLTKQYKGTFLLGRRSDTEDIEGQVETIPDAVPPSEAEILAALPQFTGKILQRPPAYSAIKVKGKRAYERARAGDVVELTARPVTINEIALLDYQYPELRLSIVCGSGTYIRSLGRDLAETIGSCSVMSALTRTAIGPFQLAKSTQLEQLTKDGIEPYLLPPLTGVPHLPQVELSSHQIEQLADGRLLSCNNCDADEVAAIDPQGQLLAILQRQSDEGDYHPKRNFAARFSS